MDEPLDLRSLKCPLPAMLARKALARLGAGQLLIVLADDPMALVDIPHMCHGEGHAVEGVIRHAAYAEFRIRAGAAVRPEVEAAAAEAGPDDPAAPRQDPDGGSPRRR
jgi:tRNA 2-thiouridine synthesizing protein A